MLQSQRVVHNVRIRHRDALLSANFPSFFVQEPEAVLALKKEHKRIAFAMEPKSESEIIVSISFCM